MSQFILHGLGSRFGSMAPPIDRSAPLATPRSTTRQQLSLCGRWRTTEVLPSCAATALRRRAPSSGNSGAAGGGEDSAAPATSGRAAQLFDLDREGAYETISPASAPPTVDPVGGDGAFLDDGWGVVAVGAPPGASAAMPVAKREKKGKQKKQLQAAAALAVAGAAASSGGGAGTQRPVATPFFDKSSEAGLTGLTLLQARLVEEGRLAHGAERKAEAAAEAAARAERRAKTARRKRDWVDPDELDIGEGETKEMSLDLPDASNQQQYFELNLEADGSTEVVEFDDEGRIKARRAPGAGAASSTAGRRRRRRDEDDADDDDPLAFLADLEDDSNEYAQAAGDDDDDDDEADDVGHGQRAASGAAAGHSRRGAAAAPPRKGLYGTGDVGDDDEEDGGDQLLRRRPLPGQDPLADEEIEWGLDELRPAGRPSLLRELGVIKKKSPKRQRERQAQAQPDAQPQTQQQQQQQSGVKAQAQGAAVSTASAARGKSGTAAAATPSPYNDEFGEDEYGDEDEREVSVAWGGSGGASGIDMEQQEALLSRLFRPHKVKQLMAHQRAAEEELAALKRNTSGRQVLESKTHSRMRIIAGSAAGRQLASSQGATTRPMMEKVRQAIFNIIQSQAGSGGGLPESSRWLDCFAGTGSVGLEALSRGCRECHFIELDPWVCRKVLGRNISTCSFQRRSVVHTMKAEDFLRRSIDLPRFAGGPFDFVSVCPPYLVVSYPELMDLLNRSPLLHERSIVFVEYPKQLAHQVPPTLGSLVTVRDRKYGRTYIRVYGPAGGPADDGDVEDSDGERATMGCEGDELLL